MLLEDGQLKIHRKLREAAALVRELTDIRVSPEAAGEWGWARRGRANMTIWLVAVALACWRAPAADGDRVWDSAADMSRGEPHFDGQVLEGGLSVEEARAVAARGAWGLGETYESAADYDPVLRSHCRLDEGEEEDGDKQ